MARKARIDIEGGLYHIISRGNNRQPIFGSHEDYAQMLRLLQALPNLAARRANGQMSLGGLTISLFQVVSHRQCE
jgi:REP element-mobilizing transposase RayT